MILFLLISGSLRSRSCPPAGMRTLFEAYILRPAALAHSLLIVLGGFARSCRYPARLSIIGQAPADIIGHSPEQ
jgi:hypothetical protein